MNINVIDEGKALTLLREWNGEKPGARLAEAERLFRVSCERYVQVIVDNQWELNRLGLLEAYITEGRCFYLYLRCPTEVAEAVRAGKTQLPRFFQRAEARYSSICSHGPVRLLVGILDQRLDRNYDLDLFIDLLNRQGQESQTAPQPQGPLGQGGAGQPGQSNVIRYQFGRQVS